MAGFEQQAENSVQYRLLSLLLLSVILALICQRLKEYSPLMNSTLRSTSSALTSLRPDSYQCAQSLGTYSLLGCLPG